MTAVGMHIGRYELLRLLSSGGMGEVYLARQTSSVEGFATLAAIKVLLTNLSTNKGFVQMFLDEARIVGRLHHKNIVQIRDIAEHDGQYYMAMEYIPGQTLRELLGDASIRDRPLFAPQLGCEIFADLASALGTAHAAGLVHRDVSPNNIMISDEGVPKLIDFGIARAMGSTSLTSPGTLKGKFGYMAPEYVRSEAYDARVDVFSLGVVIWETFARRRLFRGTSAAEQLHQLLESEIPRLDAINPEIPADLATLVQGALERDPQRRIASAMMLSDALSELAQTLAPGPDPSLRRWLERRIPGRLEDRKLTDQVLISLPPGSPIPDFGPAVAADAESIPGTYGNNQDVSGRHSLAGLSKSGSQGGFQGPPPSSRTSIQMAAGEFAPGPGTGSAPPANPPSRALLFGALGAALALAFVIVFMIGRDPAPASPTPAVAVLSDASPANPEMSLAEAHRQIGLKAMSEGNYAKARREYADALRAGGEGDLVQLMQLATELEAEASARAPASTPPAPTVATADTTADTTAVPIPTVAAPAAPRSVSRVEVRPARGDRKTAPRPAPVTVASTVKTEVADRPSVEPARSAPAPVITGDLVVTSITPKLVVLVDGNIVGQTPLRVKLSPGDHQLVVKAGAEQLETRGLTIASGETARIHVEKQPAPAVENRPVTAVAPVRVTPVPPPKPAPAPTPRVTATGDAATGARVVAACNSCHTRAGAGAVSSRRYTRAQWDRFFATGQHDRYVPIGDQMNAAQLSAAKAFLRTKSADAPENQGAGIRE